MAIKKVGLLIDDFSETWIPVRLAQKEIDVIIVSKDERKRTSFQQEIDNMLNRQIEKYVITASEKKVVLSRISFHDQLDVLKDVDLVVESINCSLNGKHQLFDQLENILPKETIIATNTVCLRISDLQKDLQHPNRVIGLHFVRHAVEIVKGKLTSEATYYTVQAFIDKLKVFSARVKEAPGYVFDRLILSFFNEAVNVLAEGLTTAEELDELIKTAFSWRIGPLEMADRIGLDEILYKLEELYHVTRNVKYLPSTYLQNLVAQGKLGIRVQEGFFKYSAEGKRIHKVEVDTYEHTRH